MYLSLYKDITNRYLLVKEVPTCLYTKHVYSTSLASTLSTVVLECCYRFTKNRFSAKL